MPRVWPLRPSDLAAIAGANVLLIVGMWVRHGGLGHLADLPSQLTSLGELSALLGTYAALVQVVLMARTPWLDQLFGMDRLANWHRWLGFGTLWLLVGHGILTTIGYAMVDGLSIPGEAWSLVTTYPFVLMATVGLGLFMLVGVTSLRLARRSISYETWYFVHLYAYLAIILSFAHALVVGADFMDDPIARLYWIALYGLAAASVIAFRLGAPIRLSLRHRLRVANVAHEAPGVVSVYLTGLHLDRLAVRSGQFFIWRFLAGDGWWRAHPFSLSAAPNGTYLRITIKDVGDYTSALQHLRRGTPVFIEGPYGAFTGARRTKSKVLLVAGGIGITPVRALLEDLPAPRGGLTLLYRARTAKDFVFRDEIDALLQQRGGVAHYLVGKRGASDAPADPFDPRSILRLIPDVRDREIYVCGPGGLTESVRRSLRTLQVPAAQIHWERFAY